MTAVASLAPPRSLYVKLSLVAFFWAGTFIAGRLLAESVPPLVSVLGRYAIALAILLILLWKREGGLPRLNRSQALSTFALGLSGVYLYNLAFFEALSEMPASRTAVFVALNPSFTALLMLALWRSPLPRRKWLGIGTALCGAVIVISRGDMVALIGELGSSFGRGELLMTCATLSWAAYTIIGKKTLEGMSALGAVSWATLWGFLLLIITAGLNGEAIDPSALEWTDFGAILYLAVLGTVIPLAWYYQGVDLIGPDRTAIFTNLVPVFGVLLGIVLLGEALVPSLVVGTGLVLIGVVLSNRESPRKCVRTAA